MADVVHSDGSANQDRRGRPSVAQVKALTEYMQKHPDLAHRKFRYGMSHDKFKKFWTELTDTVNSIRGTIKSTKGWIKFWSDKRRSVELKEKQIKAGEIQDKLTSLEQKILEICSNEKITKKTKFVKVEPCNGDGNSMDNDISHDSDDVSPKLVASKEDLRHLNMLEQMVEAMNHQSTSLAQVAQVSISNSKTLELIAEASQKQVSDQLYSMKSK